MFDYPPAGDERPEGSPGRFALMGDDMRIFRTLAGLGLLLISRKPSGGTASPLLASLMTAALLATGGCGHRDDPLDTSGPDHRIAYLITQHHGVPTPEKYQAFMEEELGPNFTAEDFARYEERSGAVCQRDLGNGKTYCMWANFGRAAEPNAESMWHEVEDAIIFCFWADPRYRPPRVRGARIVGTPLQNTDVRESRAYILSHDIPSCRQLLQPFRTRDLRPLDE